MGGYAIRTQLADRPYPSTLCNVGHFTRWGPTQQLIILWHKLKINTNLDIDDNFINEWQARVDTSIEEIKVRNKQNFGDRYVITHVGILSVDVLVSVFW